MARYDELVKSLRQAVTPDDVVAAMISQLRRSEFPADPLKIHGAIYRLREEFPDLLGEFLFFKGNLYPFSELLERVLFRLKASLTLSTISPSFDKYLITDEVKKELRQRVLSRFPKETQEEIKLLAHRFEML
ncbi:MAG: hypothetical protein QXI12_12140 [Candidatus Methanomethyliaceae archaeon]